MVNDDSRDRCRRIMRERASRGAERIPRGCTEIELFVGPDDAPVLLFDTSRSVLRRDEITEEGATMSNRARLGGREGQVRDAAPGVGTANASARSARP